MNTPPLKIGVDIVGLLSGSISGVEQYMLQILRHLLTIDTHNRYIFFYVSYKDLDQKLETLLETHPFLKAPNVEIRKMRWINFPLLLHALFKPLDWPKVDKVIGGLDVMFMPSPRLLPLSRDCKKVTTFHDLIFFVYPQYYTFKSRLWQWQMSYGYEARSSDRVIAVSNSTKRDVVRLCQADPGKVTTIYEAVGGEYSEPVDPAVSASLKEKFNIPEKYLFYVGSLEPRKNIGLVIKSLAALKAKEPNDTMKLVLSGGKSWLSTGVYKLIEELGLKDSVIFTGRVSETEKIALYQHALALVFPSFYEGFGLMILEAFGAGCPVITSNVSSLPEIAGDAALLVDPSSEAELTHAIKSLLTDSHLRQELITKGKARAAQFSWAEAAKATLQVFEEVTHVR